MIARVLSQLFAEDGSWPFVLDLLRGQKIEQARERRLVVVGGAHLTRLDLEAGFLVVFDRRCSAPPLEERIAFETAQTPEGYRATVLRA